MKEVKRLKDPIYGYIVIPNRYMNGIIDTAVFQRLRRIIQTSYSPLYSSAVHNRFVHSLGVYHLGCLAFDCIREEIPEDGSLSNSQIDEIGDIFKLACLLHDVGHAPFSHTGEIFYLKNEKYDQIHGLLLKYVNDESFSVPSTDSKAAAPHEIMSAIVGLKEFACMLPEDNAINRSFFARCITGYLYDDDRLENKFKNCFISLLNSKVIDVDKLDYLIRDAFVTGFDTVHIDYIRLISSLKIKKNNNDYCLAYHKSALSVIENVVYAHDAERKWIQNHPVVVYDGYLLYHMIRHLNEKLCCDSSRLFSLDSLSLTGVTLDNGTRLRLMSDDDIIYLSKNVYSFPLSEEYFDRSSRRHPAWKSEAEYRASFLGNIGSGAVLEEFENSMEMIGNYLKKNSTSGVINDELIKEVQDDVPSEDDIALFAPEDKKLFEKQKQTKETMLRILYALRDYAQAKNVLFDFVILTASQFNSGFGKPDFAQIDIFFPDVSKNPIRKFREIASSLNAKESQRDKFFYLFYKRKDGDISEIDCDEISLMLYKACM